MRLCIRATRVLYVTVQERNPRMKASVHNCVVEKPAYRYKLFLKKKEKSTRISKTVIRTNQDKVLHTNFEEKTGQG